MQARFARSGLIERELFQSAPQFPRSGGPFGKDAVGGLADKNVSATEPRNELSIAFFCEIEFRHARFVAIAQAIEAALETIHALGITRRILRAMIAVVPVQDIEAAIGPNFQ